MKELHTYKHIIWDWNGTLLDDLALCVELINTVLIERGCAALSTERYQEIFTFPVEEYYKQAGLDFSKEPFSVVGKIWMDGYEAKKHTCTVMEGATKILGLFQSHGIGQSVLSAYSQHTLIEIITSHGLHNHFTHIKGLDNIYASGKTGLGIELVKELGLNRGEALMIGDTLHDAEVAEAIGADCILVARGHQSYDRLLKSGRPVFHSLTELAEQIALKN